jgi:hypothetical protein
MWSSPARSCAVSHGQMISLILYSIDPGFAFRDWESLSNPDAYLLDGGAVFDSTACGERMSARR